MGIVEIKCKRCGAVQKYQKDDGNLHVFTFFADMDGTITDSCEGVVRLGYERRHLVGKALADLFPLVRDAPRHIRTLESGVPYQIQNNALVLRDGRTTPVESFFVPVIDGGQVRYRIFNILRTA